MKTPSYDIVIKAGATFRLTLKYKDGDGTPIDLTGRTAKADIRKTAGGALIHSIQNADITMNASGDIVAVISAAVTKTLAPCRDAEYDLFVLGPGAEVEKILRGRVEIEPSITQTP